ncbi:excinuclease ABC subunit UvrC [Candidatus Dojkabacteria bacterium]|uniref:Excinuclease ABC subunit UvrC n=1 Tax=Candidatus Dojkabacteria bacterium TaxID=2099670 RepID=A0A3M0YYD7_9BACT|nr:MAG: excinuclease ABC subunit UvrC [Candidatus Dojkabacteria bacterium]
MKILETKSKQFQEKVRSAPKSPGCYLFKNAEGKVLYVGKAKNLYNRIKSYFASFNDLEKRKQQMIEQTEDVEFIVVDSEVEAIILENNLIKKYKTKYNILMRDDKNYSWILIEDKVPKVNDFPRIRIIRDSAKKNHIKGELFGPFPSQLPLRNILKKLRKLFPYATCNRKMVEISSNPTIVESSDKKPCLYFHLGLCKAPCASLQNSKDYNASINKIKKFFRGEKNEIIKEYEKEMFKCAKSLDFENANIWKKKIEEIRYITAHIKVNSEVDDISIAEIQKSEKQSALKDLIEKLDFPKEKLFLKANFKIECYDISNIQGTNPVGAMTVMINGELKPELYRRFKIRNFDTPNDYAMMQEMLERRLKHIKETKKDKDISLSQPPDLIVVDGGKGQLSSAYKILRYMGFENIPIIGIAKKNEEVYKITHQFRPKINEFEPEFEKISMNKKSSAILLIQRIRDEAHRFGITFHRKLRTKKMILEQNLD